MIVGLDFSLTATGVCAITDGEAECITVGSKKEDAWYEFPERVESIAGQADSWLAPDRHGGSGSVADVQLVLESPAFAARSSSLDRLFGGWWIFAHSLMWIFSYSPPLLVTPSQVKKFATGKGNAGKDEVLLAVARRYPDVQIKNNNEADALVLAAIGAAAMEEPFNGTLTKYQKEVIEAVRLGAEKK